MASTAFQSSTRTPQQAARYRSLYDSFKRYLVPMVQMDGVLNSLGFDVVDDTFFEHRWDSILLKFKGNVAMSKYMKQEVVPFIAFVYAFEDGDNV